MLSTTENSDSLLRKSSRPRNIPSKLSKSTNINSSSESDSITVYNEYAASNSTSDISGFSIFQQWSSPGCALKLVLDDWVVSWDKNAEIACISLLNAILCASDIITSSESSGHFYLTTNDYSHGDPAVLLNELQLNWKNNLANPPPKSSSTISKHQKILKKSLSDFFQKWTSSFWITHSEQLKTLLTWLMTMSSSSYRQLRSISTLICFTILQGSARATIEFGIELDQSSKISSSKSASLAKGSGRTVDILTSQISSMESIVQMLFDGVFVQRFRDIDHNIRELSVQCLGDWILTLDEVFLENCYLRYLGWSLSDREHSVRATSLRALQSLYLKDSPIWKEGLLAFTSRFKGRILEMAHRDIDPIVRKESIILLSNALSSSVSNIDSNTPSLIISRDCEPIITSILRQSFILYQNNFGSKPIGTKSHHSIRSSNHNLLSKESISLLSHTLFDGLNLLQSRDRYSLLLQQLQPNNRGPLYTADAPIIIKLLSFMEGILDSFKSFEEKMLFSEFLFRDSTFKATYGPLFKDVKKIFIFYYSLFETTDNQESSNATWNLALESSKSGITLRKESLLLLIAASIRQITLLPLDSLGRRNICTKMESNIHSKLLVSILEDTTFFKDVISTLKEEIPNPLLIGSMFQILLYCNFDSKDCMKFDSSILLNFLVPLFSTESSSFRIATSPEDPKTITNLISSFLLKMEMFSITSSLLRDLSNPLEDGNIELVTILSKWCSGSNDYCLCGEIVPYATQSFIEHCEIFISSSSEDYFDDPSLLHLMSFLIVLSKHFASLGKLILSSNVLIPFISKLMSFEAKNQSSLPPLLTITTLHLIDSCLTGSGDGGTITGNQRHVLGSSICLLVHHSLALRLLGSSSSSSPDHMNQRHASYSILFMAVRLFLKFDLQTTITTTTTYSSSSSSSSSLNADLLFTSNQLSEFYRWIPFIIKDTECPDSLLALNLLKNTLFNSALEIYPSFLERVLESVWEALFSEPDGCESEFLDSFYRNSLLSWISEYPKEIFSSSLHLHLIEHCSLKNGNDTVGDDEISSSSRWPTLYPIFMDHILCPLVPLLRDDEVDSCLSLLERTSIDSSITPAFSYQKSLQQKNKKVSMKKNVNKTENIHLSRDCHSSPNPFNSPGTISLSSSSPIPIEGLSELALDNNDERQESSYSPIGRPKRKRSINY